MRGERERKRRVERDRNEGVEESNHVRVDGGTGEEEMQ